MISRRDVLVGGILLGASAGAWAWTPRERMSLLGNHDLEKLIPRAFGQWRELPAAGLVVPDEEDSLAARLYAEQVGRIYATPDNDVVMLLIAYGGTQSDALQLHRPEVCYPAFGFDIRGGRDVPIPLASDVQIPGRSLEAVSDMRTEQILYWTRIGEFLPSTGAEQRWARLRSEMSGTVPDGILVRISSVGTDAERGLELNRRLATDLMNAVGPDALRVLLGTGTATALTS